jgi:hypothetical protein
VRKEAAVVALGCAISGAIVLWSLRRSPEPPPPPSVDAPQENTSDRPCAWWVEFDEVRTGCGYIHPATLLWLTTHHNDDGSYGKGPMQLEGRTIGKVGLTSLALLPFLGAGFTPLSKDVYVHEGGDWHLGKEIRKSFEWLQRNEHDDGTFPSAGDFDQILAAYALSELYGSTALPDWKPPAQRAVDALLKMQKPDGTWDGEGPTAWAIIALHSARLSDLSVDASAIDRALRAPGYPGHPGEALARVLLKDDAKAAVFRLIDESRERDASNVSWWYLATISMWAYGGTSGKEWWDYTPGPVYEKWAPILREKLLPLLEKDGSVSGTSPDDSILRTSLAQLTLGVYYQYSNAFRPH